MWLDASDLLMFYGYKAEHLIFMSNCESPAFDIVTQRRYNSTMSINILYKGRAASDQKSKLI